jgi:hypothetical protein
LENFQRAADHIVFFHIRFERVHVRFRLVRRVWRLGRRRRRRKRRRRRRRRRIWPKQGAACRYLDVDSIWKAALPIW